MDDEEVSPSGSRMGGCLVQVVTHGVAIVLGAVLGIGGARLLEYYQNPEVFERPEGELSRAELIAKLDSSEAAYATLLAEGMKKEQVQQTEIDAAGKKVTDLQTQVTTKQDELKVLELKVKKSQGKSAALKKELEEKVAELEGLQAQLTTALAEKAVLEQDLVVSREETQVARSETRQAQDETTDAKWDGFKSEAIVTICEKGNRNKLAKCKEEVRTAMNTDRAARYKACVNTGQAAGRLTKVDAKVKDPQLPKWSEWLDQDSSFTKNAWYITFCDPTLPEATGLGSNAPTKAEPSDLDDLDL